MKRPSREINIFNISALDLFASALGAFIIVAIIIFPYYMKNSDAVQRLQQLDQENRENLARMEALQREAETARQQLQQCQQQSSNTQSQHDALRSQLRQCIQKMSSTFIAFVMKWGTKDHDVDLHIVDPMGREFYYKKPNRQQRDFPDSVAELSVDTIQGPGVEIWEQPQAPPGEYKVYFNFFAQNGNPSGTIAEGTLYYRDGTRKLPAVTLRRAGEKPLVATIRVGEDGTVTIN